MTAQNAFQGWALSYGLIGLVLLVVVLGALAVIVATSTKRRRD